MTVDDILNYVTDGREMTAAQSYARAADLARVTPKTIYYWRSVGEIPLDRQALIQVRTRNKLKMDSL